MVEINVKIKYTVILSMYCNASSWGSEFVDGFGKVSNPGIFRIDADNVQVSSQMTGTLD